MHLGKFEVQRQKLIIKIDVNELKEGINNLKNFIIKKGNYNEILYVINKICDHAGGKLIVKGDKAVCPMHNWQLNLNSLDYNNSHEKKKQAQYYVDEASYLCIVDSKRSLKNTFCGVKQGEVNIRWINHATVFIECNGISIITDPWIFGPAFLTGWWLNSPSPSESMDLLKQADYVYISHNHPDHLHAETLALLDKKKTIITPNFLSKSSEIFLKNMGFKAVISCDFLDIFELGKNFQISILKSGDFRDDSGIYICANGHEILLTVDSNYLNSHVLPSNIDILMTSFAGGASGFPLCYDNYNEQEKMEIIQRNRHAIKANVINYIKSSLPAYYMPYAGMFSEYSERDNYIKEKNHKNTFEEYEKICKQLNVKAIKASSEKLMTFQNGEMILKHISDVTFLEQESYSNYINHYKSDFLYDAQKILSYLKDSNYHAKQVLQIIPTDDDFERIIGPIIYADFHLNTFKIILAENLITDKEEYAVMQMKVRPEIIMCVITNYLPWEDLSIGFQMRVTRQPNEYESDFWYHFTNQYIAKESFRYTSYCGSCSIINQNPIWVKPNN